MGASCEWRILFLALEYADPIFSGNGVYGRSIVRILSELKDRKCRVLVICGQPEGQVAAKKESYDVENVQVLKVTVPIWYKLDRYSSWMEYGLGVEKYVDQVKAFKADVVLGVDWTSTLAFQTLKSHDALLHIPSVYLNFRVYFESTGICAEDAQFYREKEGLSIRVFQESIALSTYDATVLQSLFSTDIPNIEVLNPPLSVEMRTLANRQVKIGLNFARQLALYRNDLKCSNRIHELYLPTGSLKLYRSRSLDEGADGECTSDEGAKFSPSASMASSVVSEDDSVISTGLRSPGGLRRTRSAMIDTRNINKPIPKLDSLGGGTTSISQEERIQHGFGGPRPMVFSYLKTQKFGIGSAQKRCFITCCCRICPEKNVSHFVDTVILLSDFLKKNQYIPCLVGPPIDEEFANEQYRRLDQVFPGKTSRVIPKFASSHELALIFSETVLNVHPATYEAYGMTIVEAAAFGAPTLMHSTSQIGAADLVDSPLKSIRADMTNPRTCATVMKSLLQPDKLDILRCIGMEACAAALEWDDTKFGMKIVGFLETSVKNRFRSFDYERASEAKSIPQPKRVVRVKSLEQGGEEDGIWIEIIEWVVTSISSNCEVIDIHLDTIKHLADSVVELDHVDFSKRIENEWKRRVAVEYNSMLHEEKNGNEPSGTTYKVEARKKAKFKLEDESKSIDRTKWAHHFINKPTISKARYKLVPSRVPEIAFWDALFTLIRRAVALHLETNPYEVLGKLAERYGTSPVHELARVATKSSSLKTLAKSLINTHHITIVAGSPCVFNNPITPQKSDGPLGSVMILHALLGVPGFKTGIIITEHTNAFPVMACMGVYFGKKLESHSSSTQFATELSSFAKEGDGRTVLVETFPTGDSFAEVAAGRLHDVGKDMSDEAVNQIMFVERLGPNAQNMYLSHDGKQILAQSLAPLHNILKGSLVPTSAVVSGNANNVGMGHPTLRKPVATYVPLGGQTVCEIATDDIVIGSQANLACFALIAAVALALVDMKVLKDPTIDDLNNIMGTETQLSEALHATANSGTWDASTGKRSNSVAGVEFQSIIDTYTEMRNVVWNHWEKMKLVDY